MNGKLPKKIQKSMFFGKLGRKRSKIFGDRVRSGLGIEKAVEREAGRARRGQDGAKIGPTKKKWAKNRPKHWPSSW